MWHSIALSILSGSCLTNTPAAPQRIIAAIIFETEIIRPETKHTGDSPASWCTTSHIVVISSILLATAALLSDRQQSVLYDEKKYITYIEYTLNRFAITTRPLKIFNKEINKMILMLTVGNHKHVQKTYQENFVWPKLMTSASFGKNDKIMDKF